MDGGIYHIPAGEFNMRPDAEPGLEYAGAPLLYGDGIHDDVPALNAGISGKPVRCAFCLEFIDFTGLFPAPGPQCPSKHRLSDG